MLNLESLYKQSGGVCWICGKHVNRSDATREHVWPKGLGGPNIQFNLRLTHKECNSNRKIDLSIWSNLSLEDGCWMYSGENIQSVRNIFRDGDNLVPQCGLSKCVRPDHMVEL